MSFARSRSSMLPSGCHTARSPEWNQPPRNACVGRLVVGEVAAHQVVAAHHDLAHRLGVAGHVVVVGVDHPHEVGGRVALALPGAQPRLLGRRLVVPGRQPRRHGDRPVRLGQAVDVDGPEVELGHAREQRRRRRRGGDERRHRRLDAMRGRVVDDRQLHGRGAAVVRHSLVVDQPPHLARVDLADRHVRRADRRHRPREAPAVAVEHRQRPQVRRLGRQPGHDALGQRVQVRAAVGVLHALRPAGGARRVVDRDRLLLVGEPRLRIVGRGRGEQRLVRAARPRRCRRSARPRGRRRRRPRPAAPARGRPAARARPRATRM